MKKPRLTDLNPKALIALVKQKKDEKFTQCVKEILVEKELQGSKTLPELLKELTASKDNLLRQIKQEVITLRLIGEEDDRNIIMADYLIEKLPIDNLVQLSQRANNPNIKLKANQICRKLEEKLEEELNIGHIAHEKYNLDEQQKGQTVQPKSLCKGKTRISISDQFDNSITTRKFLQDFYGLSSLSPLSHEEMEKIIYEKGLNLPRRGRIQKISYDQVARGEWILVRNKKRGKVRIIPYENPSWQSLENLSTEIKSAYQKKFQK